ncbi:MAG: hypothetical protein ACI89L_000063 [Phycisphaerales bacterium]|jgi:hypothetical protein
MSHENDNPARNEFPGELGADLSGDGLTGFDLTSSDQAAADRVRSAMTTGGLEADLRARLIAGAAPAMEQNRRQLGPSRRFLWRAAVRGGPWAAAAVLLLTVSLVLLSQRPSTTTPTNLATLDPMDTNADGVLDILDARALAVAVAAGDTATGEDLNHDGVVSLADADAIATRVVRLGVSG